MTDIPDIHSPCVALYLHYFIEWDSEKSRYVSCFDKLKREAKKKEVNDILCTYTKPSIEELNFLYAVEEDPEIKKDLKKTINRFLQALR